MDILSQLGLTQINPGVWSGCNPLTTAKGKKLQSIEPATEETLAEVITGDSSAYETLITHAQEATLFWRTVTAPKRGELIYQIGQSIRHHQEALAQLITLEMGKPKAEALGEVQEMIDMADFAVGQSRMLYGKTMHSERPFHRMYEQWHPYGVVGVFSAFNFPMAVWSWNAFLSIICGNAVVWKPSSKTPLCAIALHKLCADVLSQQGYPALFSVFIPESHEVAERLINDQRAALISFTGSTKVGHALSLKVTQRFGRCLLELGGNNAIIVDESADLKLAIPAIVFGAIGTAGQRCTTTRRVFVHKSLFQEVVTRLKQAYSTVKIGCPLDPKNHMGPLVDADAVKQYEAAIAQLHSMGAEVVFGGKRLAKKGYYVEPTIITQVQADWELLQTETFSPILYVMPYSDLKEAIHMQNAVPQGLSSALFTQQLQHAELFLSAWGSDCGIANINIGTSGAEIGGAFGGEKETGGGREAGSDAWKAYMRRQTNTINWGNQLPLAQGIQFEL